MFLRLGWYETVKSTSRSGPVKLTGMVSWGSVLYRGRDFLQNKGN